MIAGLLGEHLSSPRTALKTNQNTALEPKPAPGGEPSNGEEFAAYVADDPKPKEAPQTRSDPDNREANAASDVAAERSSRRREARAERAAETDAKPLPVPIAPAEDSHIGVSPGAVLGDTPEILPASGSNTEQANVTATPEELLANAREIDPRVRAEVPGDAAIDNLASDQNIKFTQGSIIEPAISENEVKRILTQSLPDRDGQTQLPTTPVDAEMDLGRLGSNVDIVDGELTRIGLPAETTDAQLRNTASTGLQTATGDLTTMIREGAATGADTILNIGPTTAPSGPAVATTPGLTPVAPSIPIASPSELTSIIMNAIQNGMDPQEQLIVQLDPPELGRIMIDFKFDAQGLQQIVVSSENPEALKRLREMHAELTAALQDQGLTGENLSFQQDTQDRSQTNMGSQSRSDRELVFSASDDGRSARMTGSSEPGSVIRTRLDLVL
ncbi:MAG: flagellar hook-length control protein FliK [Pseudomonadota bacterium]|nr:flagellar hook-length control protein FliK [Pseudomonadota bacterium]